MKRRNYNNNFTFIYKFEDEYVSRVSRFDTRPNRFSAIFTCLAPLVSFLKRFLARTREKS